MNCRAPHKVAAAARISLLALSVGVAAVRLSAAPPQLQQSLPLAVTPGKTVELTLRGQHLQEPRKLWTSFATRADFVPADDETSKKGEKLLCRVTAPREAQVGIGVLRLATSGGVSNPILLMVDDLRSILESGENHTVEQAQLLDLPIAVDGQCDAPHEDFYRFYATAGQRLSFEVVSQRLGRQLDSVLRLLRADGQQLQRVDDSPGAGGDSRFSHLFEEDGDYLLAISDVRKQGGDAYRYRLRIGTYPIITGVYPAGGQNGTVTSFQVFGPALKGLSPLHVALPSSSTPQLVSFSLRNPEDNGSGWFQVEAQPSAESLEQEPNDTTDTASAAVVPGAINGRLEEPGDQDHFRFQASKGQQLVCRALTRELGSPCDLRLSLHKADGSQLAEARQDRDTLLAAAIPADGEYFFRVEDLLFGGSSRHIYRLIVAEQFTGFTLHAEQMQYVAPHAGTAAVKVLAKRNGYGGPIELSVTGLGPDVKLEGNKLEGDEGVLRITLPPGVPQGALRLAKIVGSVEVDGRKMTVAANQRKPLVALFPNALSLPSALEETIALGVGPPMGPFFELAVADNTAYFPQLVGTSTFDVQVNRINGGFKEQVALTVNGLPEGVSAEVAKVDDGLKAYRVTLKGPPDLPAGEFPLQIVGTGRFQEQSKTVTLENVMLRVIQPLVVGVTLPGPVPVGGMQEADVRVRRFGADPEPVRVQVNSGPSGLLAPIFIEIPSDSNEAKLTLNAASSAAPGTYDNLTVVATTSVKGQNIRVESAPASVTVEAPPASATAEETPPSS